MEDDKEREGAPRRRRLVAFLGKGPGKEPPYYTQVRYCLEGLEAVSSKTALVQRALVELLGFTETDQVVLLGTEEVKKRWIDPPEKDARSEEGAKFGLAREQLGRDFVFLQVPTGRSSAELRELFQWMLHALDPARFEAPDGAGHGIEAVPTDRLELLLDVTHGFRIQPLFGTQALHFAVAEWERAGVPLPAIRILYGAFDAARDDDPKPIWDLTETMTAARWNRAIDALMRYGRGDALAALAREETGRLRGEGMAPQMSGRLGSLGREARAFADDLATGRLHGLLTRSAPVLARRLDDEVVGKLLDQMPYLRGPMAALRERVEGLRAERVHSEEGVAAALRLARFLGDLQRFLEQASVLRETLATWVGLREGRDLPEPHQPGIREARAWVDERLGELARAARDERLAHLAEDMKEVAKLADLAVQVRNDMDHLGLNKQPQPAQALREALGQLQRGVERIVLGESPNDAA